MSMNTSKIKVLYVDDEESNLIAFRATFRREMQVFTTTSPEEALAILEKERIPVVISDQRMPLVSGSDLLATIKHRHPDTIRMLLTGYADLQAVIDAVNKGNIYAYVTKPWDANDLRLRIQQAMEIHDLRGERERLFRRYRQVFESSGDPIVIVDEQGAILSANPATEQLLGASFPTIHELGMRGLLESPDTIRKALSGKRRGRSFQNVDLTLKAPNGHTIDCLLTISYLGQGEAGGRQYQAIIKDITDRRQEEQRLVRLNSELDRRVAVRTRQLLEALEDLGSFSYTVAHDLRSPLKNVLAMSQMLNEHLGSRQDQDASDLASRIERGASRMIELVDDLLRFSQSNNHALRRTDLDLGELVAETLQELPKAPHAPKFVTKLPPNANLHADGALLKVLLMNLLSNAVKFTRQAEAPTIEIGMAEEPEGAHLWVKDNGVGFDSSGIRTVFSPFKRMHRTDQFEGSGIGLAIVQRVVNKHGGEVWAESAVGKGTTIHVRIPAAEPERQMLPFAS